MNTEGDKRMNRTPKKLKYHGASTSGSQIEKIASKIEIEIKATINFFMYSTSRSSTALRIGNASRGPIDPDKKKQPVLKKLP
mmetsp:Transcript_21992/g.45249  ORF Transcript_21992/g.45249 Transcript_21992/m.45249 type:complete len:82 (+) Transcript_21992:1038-1283(+)